MPQPNFLFVITDQQRADHLGCYGQDLLRTPNIDRIAAAGTAFDRFYVGSPVCMPNRAVLLTGRMPSVNGVRVNGIPLRLSATTFPQMLHRFGYTTALVGKSHLQNMEDIPPVLRRERPKPGVTALTGFEEATDEDFDRSEYRQERPEKWQDPAHRLTLPYYGFDHVDLCDSHGDLAFGDYQRWLEAEHPEALSLRGPENAAPDKRYVCPQAWRTQLAEELYPTSYIADRAVNFLQAHAASDKARPFFLMCSFNDPHHPFTPPGKYWDMYDPNSIVLPANFGQPTPEAPSHLRWLHNERNEGRTNLNTTRAIAVTEREAKEATALTFGMISMIDDAVGRILAVLEAGGLANNTIIIFTSDHGDFMGDHGLLFKHPLHYQALVRVPFIWSEPGMRRPRRSVELSGTIDIARTILERVGVQPPNGMQGRSLLPAIRQETSDEARDAMLIEDETQRVFGGFDRPLRCRTIITDRWRMTRFLGADWGELYYLENDPYELRNLWFDPAYHSIRAELTDRMLMELMASCDRSPLPIRIA